ncbi:DUF3999 family protein [Aquimarina sp. 2201CG1-2-11]|uniref:DUF3999 family protein n=1 Tax=Aquimarina discodermiae TaxID=3231043 RepID=UPI003462BE8C
MKHLNSILCCLLILVTYSFSYGQLADNDYKRELKGITAQWHKIIVPNELFEKASPNLADLRIFGLTESNDTIEIPYLLRLSAEKISTKDVAFTSLNASHNDKGYYFTFEIPSKESINQIKLDFNQENFDWRITLEGSQNQNEWFTVVENYRILSIKNNQTDFRFTKLSFPDSKYRFFRLLIDSKEKPKLTVASLIQNEITEGKFRTYSIKKMTVKEHKQTKQTVVDVDLQLPVRLSSIHIDVSETFDYYRPITIKYVTDSLKTEQGWKYNYSKLTSGTLNSIEKNEFQFGNTTVQKLKIYIDNHDNHPLTINKIEVKGHLHELIARFTNPATYFLTYGNQRATRPNYDIARFTNNIPKDLTELDPGSELIIEKKKASVVAPIFENKTWLWVIMTVIIVLLGWLSIKMIQKK